MDIYLTIFTGLCIGSFLNVCIWRVPRKISVSKPLRSYCPSCEKSLSAWQNIPVLSWLFLRGRCHGCKERIPFRYPLVELLSALCAFLSYREFGGSPLNAVLIYAFLCSLLVISFIDFDHKIIPDVISLPGTTIGLLLGIVSQLTGLLSAPLTAGAMDSLLGMFVGGGFFYLTFYLYYLVTKTSGLGGGDIKLMAFVGATLGWRSILPTIFAGSIAGSIVGVLVMLVKRSGRKTEIPFGPWLSLGAALYVFDVLPFYRF